MFGISDCGALVVAVILFLMIPGPGNLAQITSTGKGGIRAGMAAHLGWIGGKRLMAGPGDRPVVHIEARRYFKQGFFIPLMNSKAIVFYMAFFLLFGDPATRGGLATFAAMAAVVAMLTIVVLVTKALSECQHANLALVRWLEKTAGVFLIGFGPKLALTK